MWKNGEILSWEAIEKLHSATLTDKFKKHKLTFGHVRLTAFSRMNVRLATQTMSASVAKSLSDYKNDESFLGTVTDSLIQFLQVVNKFFDCLNGSHDPEGRRNKSNPFLLPYTSIEDERFKILKEEVLGFFEEWKVDARNREGNFTNEDRERMMISNLSFESLQVTIYGFCAAVQFLLRNGFASVDAKDFNQDKLEQYFGIVRMSGGARNNPTLYRLANTVQALTAQQEIAIPPKKGNTRANSVTLQVNQEPLPCRKQSKKK
ncbi:Transposable element P transposase [Frankliniella fusca]|uniref:Transposable element P transposase n=1 Tax=Frankliniella fusca TaxID=407009 RepID=A0AAE1LYP8_9NEOP|nr:Transposable element P transposase [Frankliniella fusca]